MLQDHFRMSVLVFLDDVLVYSRILEGHMTHLQVVFKKMAEHGLYAKRSKCQFGQPSLECLGHIKLNDGVSTDPNKVQAMKD